jgi:hypothetical protein
MLLLARPALVCESYELEARVAPCVAFGEHWSTNISHAGRREEHDNADQSAAHNSRSTRHRRSVIRHRRRGDSVAPVDAIWPPPKIDELYTVH